MGGRGWTRPGAPETLPVRLMGGAWDSIILCTCTLFKYEDGGCNHSFMCPLFCMDNQIKLHSLSCAARQCV